MHLISPYHGTVQEFGVCLGPIYFLQTFEDPKESFVFEDPENVQTGGYEIGEPSIPDSHSAIE